MRRFRTDFACFSILSTKILNRLKKFRKIKRFEKKFAGNSFKIFKSVENILKKLKHEESGDETEHHSII